MFYGGVEVAKLNEEEWYFFSFRDWKYATGFRTNRATTSGYWKATGRDRTVMDSMRREVVGMRKTLVFYRNRAPNGIKTGWIMHEFRIETPHLPPKEDWVLCRVFHKTKGEETTAETIHRPIFTFDAAEAAVACASSSFRSLPNNHVHFPPADDANGLLPWDNSSDDLETAFRSNGVFGDSNTQEMKYEIDDAIQNSFPFIA